MALIVDVMVEVAEWSGVEWAGVEWSGERGGVGRSWSFYAPGGSHAKPNTALQAHTSRYFVPLRARDGCLGLRLWPRLAFAAPCVLLRVAGGLEVSAPRRGCTDPQVE